MDFVLDEGGANLSVGEKQLVCLGRAILKKTKVLLIDEATANVDLNTDAFIQKKIKEIFKDSTVLTIAHRLNTIVNCDRIVILDRGNLIECDSPRALIQVRASILKSTLSDLYFRDPIRFSEALSKQVKIQMNYFHFWKMKVLIYERTVPEYFICHA